MRVCPILAFNDNYIWVLVADGCAVVVDPGQADPVLEFLKVHDLTLVALLITHDHLDHIGGVEALMVRFPNVQIFAHANHAVTATHSVDEGDSVMLLGRQVHVWRTAGHTDTHLSYVLGERVFCGDTLFSGGCGRVFTGTVSELFQSVQRLASLPDDTLLYPAHEYTASNLRFGQFIEPNNTAIIRHLATLSVPSLPARLGDERLINVFLRTSEPAVVARLQELGVLAELSPFAVFAALRELKNHF